MSYANRIDVAIPKESQPEIFVFANFFHICEKMNIMDLFYHIVNESKAPARQPKLQLGILNLYAR